MYVFAWDWFASGTKVKMYCVTADMDGVIIAHGQLAVSACSLLEEADEHTSR